LNVNHFEVLQAIGVHKIVPGQQGIYRPSGMNGWQSPQRNTESQHRFSGWKVGGNRLLQTVTLSFEEGRHFFVMIESC
jgi:hypothetical protein